MVEIGGLDEQVHVSHGAKAALLVQGTHQRGALEEGDGNPSPGERSQNLAEIFPAAAVSIDAVEVILVQSRGNFSRYIKFAGERPVNLWRNALTADIFKKTGPGKVGTGEGGPNLVDGRNVTFGRQACYSIGGNTTGCKILGIVVTMRLTPIDCLHNCICYTKTRRRDTDSTKKACYDCKIRPEIQIHSRLSEKKQSAMSLRRFYRFLPALLCMAAIFWFSSQPGSEVGRAVRPLYDNTPTVGASVKIPWLKIGHVVGYGALGAALLYGFEMLRKKAAINALGVTLIYAITDELHQYFVPGRSAGIRDVLIDFSAAGITILITSIVFIKYK